MQVELKVKKTYNLNLTDMGEDELRELHDLLATNITERPLLVQLNQTVTSMLHEEPKQVQDDLFSGTLWVKPKEEPAETKEEGLFSYENIGVHSKLTRVEMYRVWDELKPYLQVHRRSGRGKNRTYFDQGGLDIFKQVAIAAKTTPSFTAACRKVKDTLKG